MRIRSVLLLACTIVLILMIPATGHSECSSNFFDPITDICWNCIFPISMGGIVIFGSDIDSPPDNISSPICLCGNDLGNQHVLLGAREDHRDREGRMVLQSDQR